MSARETLIILTLFVLVAATWWIARDDEETKPRGEASRFYPDYYLQNATITTMNAEGKRDRKLWAESILHYPEDDSMDLTSPVLTVYKEGAPPWVIIAETGTVSSRGALIYLQGPVEISRSGSDSLRPMRLTTSNLRVRPEDNHAETDEHAFFETVGSTLEGVGMEAFFEQPGRLKLLSEVKSRYEPTPE